MVNTSAVEILGLSTIALLCPPNRHYMPPGTALYLTQPCGPLIVTSSRVRYISRVNVHMVSIAAIMDETEEWPVDDQETKGARTIDDCRCR